MSVLTVNGMPKHLENEVVSAKNGREAGSRLRDGESGVVAMAALNADLERIAVLRHPLSGEGEE